MPYVKRDVKGVVVAVSDIAMEGFVELLSADDSEVIQYLASIGAHFQSKELTETDLGFIRVIEDVVELLITKNLIRFTDLPPAAQTKMLARQKIRHELGGDLGLLEGDEERSLF